MPFLQSPHFQQTKIKTPVGDKIKFGQFKKVSYLCNRIIKNNMNMSNTKHKIQTRIEVRSVFYMEIITDNEDDLYEQALASTDEMMSGVLREKAEVRIVPIGEVTSTLV